MKKFLSSLIALIFVLVIVFNFTACSSKTKLFVYNVGDYMSIGLNNSLKMEIIELAKKYNIEKVILFGSRARGDYSKVSDVDIAVSGGDIVEFSIDVDEETNTLLQFDVVNLDKSVQKELLESIENEGVIIYEKI